MAENGLLSFCNIDLTTQMEPTWQRIADMSDLFQLMRFESADESNEIDKWLTTIDRYLPIIESMLNEAEVLLDKRDAIFERQHRKKMRSLQTIEQNYLRCMCELHKSVTKSLIESKKTMATTVQAVPVAPLSTKKKMQTVDEKENVPMSDSAPEDSPPVQPVRSRSRQLANLEKSIRKMMQSKDSSTTPTTKSNVRSMMQSAKKSLAQSTSKSTARSHSVSRRADSVEGQQQQPQQQQVQVSSIKTPFVEALTDQEFQSIPMYMRGRAQIQLLNNYVDQFNKAIDVKYKLMTKPSNTMTDSELKRYANYKEQENSETKGKRHIFSIFASQSNWFLVSSCFDLNRSILLHSARSERLHRTKNGEQLDQNIFDLFETL